MYQIPIEIDYAFVNSQAFKDYSGEQHTDIINYIPTRHLPYTITSDSDSYVLTILFH